jgi:hypothetical protein
MNGLVLVRDRLSARSDVHYGEAARADRRMGVDIIALIVRPSVAQRISHPLQDAPSTS